MRDNRAKMTAMVIKTRIIHIRNRRKKFPILFLLENKVSIKSGQIEKGISMKKAVADRKKIYYNIDSDGPIVYFNE